MPYGLIYSARIVCINIVSMSIMYHCMWGIKWWWWWWWWWQCQKATRQADHTVIRIKTQKTHRKHKSTLKTWITLKIDTSYDTAKTNINVTNTVSYTAWWQRHMCVNYLPTVVKYSCCERVIDRWNQLSEDCISCDTINRSKGKLDIVRRYKMGFFEDRTWSDWPSWPHQPEVKGHSSPAVATPGKWHESGIAESRTRELMIAIFTPSCHTVIAIASSQTFT